MTGRSARTPPWAAEENAATNIPDQRALVFGLCAVLLGLTFGVNAEPVAETTLSPYRLSPVGAERWLYRPAPEPAEDNDLPVKPEDSRPYARQIALAAQESGLDPELVHAVIAVESDYQRAAVSPKGAVGLMQVLPATAQLHGVRNPAGVAANLRAGTRHLSGLMARFDNRLDLALAAYNAGEGAVRRYNNSIPPYPETRNYVPAVVSRYRANSPSPEEEVEPSPEPIVHDYLPGTRLNPQALLSGADRLR